MTIDTFVGSVVGSIVKANRPGDKWIVSDIKELEKLPFSWGMYGIRNPKPLGHLEVPYHSDLRRENKLMFVLNCISSSYSF